MALDREQVKKIAYLARLHLEDAELDAMTEQLSKIVHFVDKLSEVDTEGVEPFVHAIEFSNVFGPDVVQPSLDRQAALANAPQADSECFKVPAVF
ncbi:MAG: Asp-tRNA(Asn)/Glu-tRNA(Gln) amidotransferase subunit GatC [Pirellulales bacterium]